MKNVLRLLLVLAVLLVVMLPESADARLLRRRHRLFHCRGRHCHQQSQLVVEKAVNVYPEQAPAAAGEAPAEPPPPPDAGETREGV